MYLKQAYSNLLTCKILPKNKKTISLRPKIPYLGIFGPQFNKRYYKVFNQHPLLYETINFHRKQKTKISLGWNVEKLL